MFLKGGVNMYENINELEYVAASDITKANELLKEGWNILNTFQEMSATDAQGFILFGKELKGYEGFTNLADEA